PDRTAGAAWAARAARTSRIGRERELYGWRGPDAERQHVQRQPLAAAGANRRVRLRPNAAVGESDGDAGVRAAACVLDARQHLQHRRYGDSQRTGWQLDCYGRGYDRPQFQLRYG